jgi:hypothetical protein
MKLKMYCWYDSKTESWGVPIFRASRGDASRMFERLVSEKQEGNDIEKYPSDFTFFEVGEYDLSNGEITVYMSKVNLGLALEYKKAQEVLKN